MRDLSSKPRSVSLIHCATVLCTLLVLAMTTGCRSWRERRTTTDSSPPPRRTVVTPASRPASTSRPQPTRRVPEGDPIRQVVCLFDQRPWLSLDAAGDRDPEGLQFRIFLVDGNTRGVLRDGTLHIDMYRLRRLEDGSVDRQLSSDWHYPTSELTTVKSNMLGEGYSVKLRWAEKDVAGTEIEILARFESPAGDAVRSGTKRLRVPKYSR